MQRTHSLNHHRQPARRAVGAFRQRIAEFRFLAALGPSCRATWQPFGDTPPLAALIVCIALIFMPTSPCFAEVVESEAQQLYEVRQASGTSLLHALNSASPVRRHGRTFHGNTAWEIRWNFRRNESASGLCAITSVTTTLSIRMTLPRLTSGTPEGAAEFARYLPALRAHEDGHATIARKAAHEIDQAIARLPPKTSCQTLENEANHTGRQLLDTARQRGIDYDTSTKHGCAQGACLGAAR